MAHVIAITALAAICGGFGRRLAGGVIADWTGFRVWHLVATMGFGALIGGPMYLAGAVWWAALATGLGVWIGHSAVGLRDAADMGHQSGTEWRDWVNLQLYGVACVTLGVLVELCPDAPGRAGPLLLAGLLISPIYAISWEVWPHLPRVRGVTDNPLTLGEWFFGAALGIGAVVSAAL